MDPFEEIKATFFQECQELLADLESGLMAMEAGATDSETINAVFRAVHSVKGGAGAFGLDELVRFAHVFETALDEMRTGRLAVSEGAVRTMLRAADMLADHLAAVQGAGDVDLSRSADLAAELTAFTQEQTQTALAAVAPLPPTAPPPSEPEADEFGFVPLRVAIDEPVEPRAGWLIRFRPRSELYAKANDVVPLVRELERLGGVETELDAADLPELEAMDPEGAYLAWTFRLAADCPRESVVDVFDFVDGDCDLGIDPLAATAEPGFDLEALLAQARAPQAPTPTDQVQAIIDQVIPAVPVQVAEAGPPPLAASANRHEAAPAAAPTIRVDLDRVDRLIDLVGELVINQAMLAQRVAESGFARSSAVSMGLDDLEQLTREIQDSVMAIRAQPVKSVFQRMPRLVREVGSMTGKQVRLVTDGENTEVDKTVIEKLSDPITHMIRNAIDHGLEDPAGRMDAGKPLEGVVRLAALHRSGRIVIEVSDDGRGIDRPRVRQKAVEKGLIEPEATLTDEEVDNLLFMPGFSTAAAVSDISGRGVGMDVVKRSIQSLGGRIGISSVPGKGSTFTMSLPLTLAVLDGMVVTVGKQTLVAPLTSVIETLQPRASDVRTLGPSSRVIAVRDAFVPLIDIGEALGWRTASPNPADCVCLLVEAEGRGRAALLVDAIQGQRQVVIKSLEANYQQVPGIAAATILGDGRVALILDIDGAIALRARAPLPLSLAS